MAVDDKGRNHPDVGTGAPSFWTRRTNQYPGCCCPPWRYNPRHPKPTNPDCPQHGTEEQDQAA
ncbi:hypothetical protein PV761_03320 [Arthrobacter sp. CC3]|uniref:hypothetical protein n=1 Tax=Arthrobacter sp. CC3 TaxID=3029185 RepID=UPI003265ADD5